MQVLGAGGPELSDQRASASYLVSLDGEAAVLVDAGPGSSLNFERSGADFNELEAVLFTHLHVDHSADLPAYIKGAYFTQRNRDLPVYGPAGNARMPSTTEFVELLFGEGGAWRYLSDYLRPGNSEFTIRPHDVPLQHPAIQTIELSPVVQLQTTAVSHGPIAAIAWRVNIAGCALVFSGDMSNRFESLPGLARDADLLVAHHAVAETANGVAINLHMRPSVIGEIAAKANVGQLLLSHRMIRTLGEEDATLSQIRKRYSGPVTFAESMMVQVFLGSAD